VWSSKNSKRRGVVFAVAARRWQLASSMACAMVSSGTLLWNHVEFWWLTHAHVVYFNLACTWIINNATILYTSAAITNITRRITMHKNTRVYLGKTLLNQGKNPSILCYILKRRSSTHHQTLAHKRVLSWPRNLRLREVRTSSVQVLLKLWEDKWSEWDPQWGSPPIYTRLDTTIGVSIGTIGPTSLTQ